MSSPSETEKEQANGEKTDVPPTPQELHDDIRRMIRPWTIKFEKPPFTMEEMVVMATIMSRRSLTQAEILLWIVQKFRWYSRMASAQLLDSMKSYSVDPRVFPQLRLEKIIMGAAFYAAFEKFEVPLIEIYHSKYWDNTYQVSPHEGRTFLRSVLYPEEKNVAGPFRLMHLPLEIREVVYKELLVLPGLNVDEKKPLIKTTTRVCGALNRVGSRDRLTARFSVEHPVKFLAILQVSKQVLKEAMPIFYGWNRFLALGTRSLDSLLYPLSDPRKNEIKHLSFQWDYLSPLEASDWLRPLLSMRKLRDLDIWVAEKDWAKFFAARENEADKTVQVRKMHGFPILCQIRGMSRVTFHTKCERIKKDLDALAEQMMLPPEPVQQSHASKRKTANDGLTANGDVSAPAKKPKMIGG